MTPKESHAFPGITVIQQISAIEKRSCDSVLSTPSHPSFKIILGQILMVYISKMTIIQTRGPGSSYKNSPDNMIVLKEDNYSLCIYEGMMSLRGHDEITRRVGKSLS